MYKNIMNIVVVVLAAFVATACTTQLEIKRIDSFGENLPKGITYSLPAVSYIADTTWELKKCKNLDDIRPNYAINVSTELTEFYVPDDNHSYVLNYENLDSGTKITTLDLDFHEGSPFIKSINTVVDDQTGEIIGNVFGGVLSIASAASGFSFPISPLDMVIADQPTTIKRLYTCNESVAKALKKIEKLSVEIELLNSENLKYSAFSWLNIDNSILPSECKKLNGYVEKKQCLLDYIDGNSQKVINKQSQIAELKTNFNLIITESKPVIPSFCESSDGSAQQCKRTLVFEDKISELKPHINKWFGDFDPFFDQSELLEEVKLTVNVLTVNASNNDVSIDNNHELNPGLVYRVPRHADFRLDRSLNDKTVEQILRKQVVIPQAGYLAILPFKNEEFDNNSLAVSFTPNGSLISAKYTTQASAQEVSRVFSESASSLLQYKQARNDSELLSLQRDAELIKAEEEKLKAQQSLNTTREQLGL